MPNRFENRVNQISFGTDGWRGIMGKDFTEDNIISIAEAFVRYLDFRAAETRTPTVAVGYDGRRRSREFAELFGKIVAAGGAKVLLSSGIVPTPVLSFATRHFGCDAGVMITASHNPPEYNGIKFKGSYGGPYLSEETKKIEKLLGEPRRRAGGGPAGQIQSVDFFPPYLSHIETLIDFNLLRSVARNRDASVLIDSMGGAGQTIIEDILTRCGWRAQTLFGTPEPTFYGRTPEPISRNLQPLSYNVRATDSILGIATDGDADRCGIVYEGGEWMNAQETILALLWHLHSQKGWRGGIVKTASVTDKVQFMAEEWKEQVYEVPVGFKHVAEVMLKEDCLFGGEESGGFGFKNHVPERDGIVSGLLFVEMVSKADLPLSGILAGIRTQFGTPYYGRIDARYDEMDRVELVSGLLMSPPEDIGGFRIKQVKEYGEAGLTNGIKFILGDSRWLLIRSSQTEFMIRLYAEGQSNEEVAEFLEIGRNLLGLQDQIADENTSIS